MSCIAFLAADRPMPDIERTARVERDVGGGFVVAFEEGLVIECEPPHEIPDEAIGFGIKPFLHQLMLSRSAACLDQLKSYLRRNMRNDEEIQLWTLWLGGDASQHAAYRPRVRRATRDLRLQVEEELDAYCETHYRPMRRTLDIESLSESDIERFLASTSACLCVRKGDAPPPAAPMARPERCASEPKDLEAL